MTLPREEEAKTSYTILVVCSGNTCRSPFAEEILRQAAAGRARIPIQVVSAGTSAVAGAPMTANAVAAAKERGVDLAGKTATPLTADLVEAADLVLVMEESHRKAVIALAPGAAERTRVVTGLAPSSGKDGIADPFGSSLEAYRVCFDDLRSVLREALPRIAELAEHHASRPGREAT